MRMRERRMVAAAVVVLCAIAAAADLRAQQDAALGARTPRSMANYEVPDVRLIRDDGKVVRLSEELDGTRSVVLAFIYTGCNTICPVTSATFAQLQRRLGTRRSQVQLVSISIDPDQDTVGRLAAYGKRVGAGPGWRLYTGTVEDSIQVQRAFDAYDGDKMRHEPDTYVRRAGSQTWVRLHGFASTDELLAECGETTASQ
jgi:protein SCO1